MIITFFWILKIQCFLNTLNDPLSWFHGIPFKRFFIRKLNWLTLPLGFTCNVDLYHLRHLGLTIFIAKPLYSKTSLIRTGWDRRIWFELTGDAFFVRSIWVINKINITTLYLTLYGVVNALYRGLYVPVFQPCKFQIIYKWFMYFSENHWCY